ncbi:MAG: glycosyltransferase family 2 protein [Prevotella sp.]|nr:glycosyltransferase family 2 protein [Candidatus Prevotella equi]
MWTLIFTTYGYFVFFYSLAIILSYVFLLVMAYMYSSNYRRWTLDYVQQMVETSPFSPGVSIVAPAYNEGLNIVENVNSLLRQKYPKFEVVIVNDGSTDDTLEKLIENFSLIEVPYDYIYHIHCQRFKRLFRSTDYRYKNLVVVDKVNGGTKADAVNGGLNVVQYPYFINTDSDCILARDAIYQCIFPVLLNHDIIAVSGTMSMSNGFTLKDNEIVEFKTSDNPLAVFQDLEYKRSFLVGKMGWSNLNAMPNVSGGYGLFNTQIVKSSGGYGFDSYAEDMDMIYRMIKYCCDFHRPYRVVQIPHTCCWTEGPSTLRILYRQRVRWGRGLIQLIHQHWRMLFNPKYKMLGLVTMPYTFFFEFMAPIIEAIGFIMFVYLIIVGGVNWTSFLIVFTTVYIFAIMLSQFVVFYDYILGSSYTKTRSYFKLFLAAIFEPFIYHPIITFCSIRGYLNYIFKTKASWGVMVRKRYNTDGK